MKERHGPTPFVPAESPTDNGDGIPVSHGRCRQTREKCQRGKFPWRTVALLESLGLVVLSYFYADIRDLKKGQATMLEQQTAIRVDVGAIKAILKLPIAVAPFPELTISRRR